MIEPINYGLTDRRERLSRSGITSLVSGVTGFAYFLYLFTTGPSGTISDAIRWLVSVPLVAIPVLGFACGVVAMVTRKRGWGLALLGLPLSILPLSVVVLVILRRFSN